ncbi:IS110 family transposase, partial [Vibrio vulnificus]
IAHYAEAIKPKLTQLKSENIRLMSDLVTRRNQLLSMPRKPHEHHRHVRLSRTLLRYFSSIAQFIRLRLIPPL